MKILTMWSDGRAQCYVRRAVLISPAASPSFVPIIRRSEIHRSGQDKKTLKPMVQDIDCSSESFIDEDRFRLHFRLIVVLSFGDAFTK